MSVDRYGSTVIAACESVWANVRKHHKDLPQVIFTLGDGKGSIWGYFNHGAWHAKDDRSGVPQVMIAGERLQHGAEGVLETVLHEAAHALAHARGISDTSRQGRYHNKRYADLAHQLGLRCEHMDATHGMAKTALTPEVIDVYARQLHDLAQVLHYYKRMPPRERKDKKDSVPPAMCECARKIPAQYLPVDCPLCGSEFKEAS